MTTAALAEFGELCRLCGSKTSVLMGLHIFEREGSLREIFKKITVCLPIQVSNDDKLPKMVCEECVYKLDALFEFREKSVKTEYALTSMLKDLYQTECNDQIEMTIEPLLCQPNHEIHSDSIHLTPPEQVEVHIEDNNAQNIDSIMELPMTNNSVKCEPEVPQDVLHIKPDQAVPATATHAVVDGVPRESLSNDTSEACSLNQHIGSGIQVTDIRSLQTLNDSVKTDEAASGRNFLVAPEQEQPWFFCDICGKPFSSSEEFQAHCEIHWKKCHVCGATCSNDEALMVHLRDIHNSHSDDNDSIGGLEDEAEKKTESKKDAVKGDMKACSECGKEYRTNYKLAEHMRKHTGEKPFKCSMCDKTFRSKIGLAQHEARHTGHYDFTCSLCGKGFQCKSYLIVHQRVHSDLKPYPCDTCGRNFKTKQSLLDHQNRHLGVKPYVCEICGRGFITKGLCKSHQKVHSGLDNRQYPCSVCNKLFVSKSYLATHMRIHTGEKPFMCEVCGKGFLTRVDLKIHSTMHTGEKSFVCEVCGKAFARRDALRCHKRSHTGERPYKCDVCGQGFTQFSPMAIHKRLHTGERPYSCDVCSKTFVSRSTMMSHRKKHVL